jgi:hypothetical protein
MTAAEKSALAGKATVVIVTYNHEEFIGRCLETVLNQNPANVIVVDSGSTDDTRDIVANYAPEVDLVTPERNRGYGAGNNVGVQHVYTKYVVVLNPDTKVEDNGFEELLQPLVDQPRSITTPKILTYDGSAINTCGNIGHFTGLGFTRGLHESPSEFSTQESVPGVSGASFAVRTGLYRELGGFDESIFLYMEDVELSWRAAARDVDITYVPTAQVCHDFEDVSMTPEKLYHVERGRYFILRKYLDPKTAILISPSLLATEVLTTGYAVLNGVPGIRNKLRAVYDGLTAGIGEGESESDSLDVISELATKIPEGQLSVSNLDRVGKRVANAIYRINHSLINQ